MGESVSKRTEDRSCPGGAYRPRATVGSRALYGELPGATEQKDRLPLPLGRAWAQLPPCWASIDWKLGPALTLASLILETQGLSLLKHVSNYCKNVSS